jgi:hypothetical protein
MVWMVWIFRLRVDSTVGRCAPAARAGIAFDIDDGFLLAHVACPLPHERASAVWW